MDFWTVETVSCRRSTGPINNAFADMIGLPCARGDGHPNPQPVRCATACYWTVNRKTVVDLYSCPGRSTVDGKCGLLGESGKCCVSRQKLWWEP